MKHTFSTAVQINANKQFSTQLKDLNLHQLDHADQQFGTLIKGQWSLRQEDIKIKKENYEISYF